VKYFLIPPPFFPSGGGHGGGRPLRLVGAELLPFSFVYIRANSCPFVAKYTLL